MKIDQLRSQFRAVNWLDILNLPWELKAGRDVESVVRRMLRESVARHGYSTDGFDLNTVEPTGETFLTLHGDNICCVTLMPTLRTRSGLTVWRVSILEPLAAPPAPAPAPTAATPRASHAAPDINRLREACDREAYKRWALWREAERLKLDK